MCFFMDSISLEIKMVDFIRETHRFLEEREWLQEINDLPHLLNLFRGEIQEFEEKREQNGWKSEEGLVVIAWMHYVAEMGDIVHFLNDMAVLSQAKVEETFGDKTVGDLITEAGFEYQGREIREVWDSLSVVLTQEIANSLTDIYKAVFYVAYVEGINPVESTFMKSERNRLKFPRDKSDGMTPQEVVAQSKAVWGNGDEKFFLDFLRTKDVTRTVLVPSDLGNFARALATANK